MKTLRLLVLSFLATALSAAGHCAPKAFEGKVRFLMTLGEKAVNMTQTIKGNRIRQEMDVEPGKSMAMIMDMEKREMTMLMPEQKMYMVMKMPDAAKEARGNAQKPDAQVELTDETETILGYKCRKLVVHSDEGATEIWGAEGMGVFMMGGGGPMGGRGGFMGRGAAPSHPWEAALAERGFYPLRLVTQDSSGKETLRMDAKEIDTSTPSDAAFEPPAGYERFDMPSFPDMGDSAEPGDKTPGETGRLGIPGLPGGLNPFKRKSN